MRANSALVIEPAESWSRLQASPELFYKNLDELLQEKYEEILNQLLLYERQQFLCVVSEVSRLVRRAAQDLMPIGRGQYSIDMLRRRCGGGRTAESEQTTEYAEYTEGKKERVGDET